MSSNGEVVGTVAQLWRFPVKSFQGEQHNELDVATTGVVGDRRYAIRDVATGKVLSAKRLGVLLEASARTESNGQVVMTLPDGTEHAPEDPGIDEVLSTWLGRRVHLDSASADHPNGVYEFAFDIDESPDAQWFDIDIPVGSFVDLAGAHLLTTASLAEIASHYPEGDFAVRRFRPTVLIDSPNASGFVEDTWIGATVTVGTARVHVDMPTIRCVMPTRPQPELGDMHALDRDKTISRTISDHHGSNLGVYCSITSPGKVHVGDAVSVARSASLHYPT